MSDAASVPILTDPVLQTICVKCRCTMETAGLSAFSQIVCPQCGHEMQVPARLGHFLLMHLIGTGGMGGVYWAHDQVLNRDVAIKVMLKSLGDDHKFVETFQREAQAAARINHPHIAQIYSFGQEKGQPYIVMELVPGGGLDKLMAVTPQLDQALVMRVGAEVADGLKRASEGGLVHGDIKPENILIGEGGLSKLVDFGIASMSGGKSNEIWGTPYYIAPEKVRRQKTDHRSDIYSLGGTLYHALAGVPPFDGADAVAVVKARFAGPPKPLSELRKDIDPAVTAIVDRMLHLEPARRYPTYDSLLGDMRRYVDRAGPGQIAASKKVLLKRKAGAAGTTGRVAGATTTGGVAAITTGMPTPQIKNVPSPPLPSGRSKGIVLQKGSMADALRSEAATTASVEVGGTATEEQPSSRNWLRIVLVAVGLLLLAVFGTIGGVIWAKTVRKSKPPVTVVQTAGARDDVMKSISGVVAKSQALSVLMADRVAKGTALVDEAVKLAGGVLGAEAQPSLVPPKQVAAAASTNVPPAAEQEGATEWPPLVAGVRAMHVELYALQADGAGVDSQVAAIVESARVADAATNDVSALRLVADDLQRRYVTVEGDAGMVGSVRRLEKLTAAFEEVKRLGVAAQTDLQRREDERKRLEAERLAKEEGVRKDAERKAVIEGELARVRECESANVALLHKFEFREARRALGRLVDGLTSNEGRQALALAHERIERLSELHVFITGRVVGFKHPSDGWTVQAADARGLTVGGKEVAWADVGDVRMVLFINTFLGDERQARDIKLRERVRQSVNGALYCVTFVKESVPVQELAGRLVAKAIELFPDVRPDAQRLVPELVKE